MNILGVKISQGSKASLKKSLFDLLKTNANLVVTPNAEMILSARNNKVFQDVLNEADLSLCDSTGVKIVSKFSLNRYTGLEATEDLLLYAAEHDLSVYVLGGGGTGWRDQVHKQLKLKYPKLNKLRVHNGPKLMIDHQANVQKLIYLDNTNEDILSDIIMTAPDILIVGFGHEKQELWLHEHLPHLPSVKIGIGTGGAVNTLSCLVPRPPAWVTYIGFGWLFRLASEPRRIKRILTAVILFPLIFIYDHFANKR